MKYFVLGLALILSPCIQAQDASGRAGRLTPAAHAAPAVEGECILIIGGALRRDMPLFAGKSAEAPRKNVDFSLIKGPPVPIMSGPNSFF